MITTRVNVATDAPYEVLVGSGIGSELPGLLGDDVHRVAIVFSGTLESAAQRMHSALRSDGFDAHLIAVPDGEAAKDINVAAFCWQVLGRTGFTRSDAIVGLGGGATTDLAGFVAASWLRGIKLITVPTTVLGMVDAAVGGKTGINTGEGKNLVGAFHEPTGVICDLRYLRSLPQAEVRSGLAEVIKCGFIADTKILELIEAAPTAVLDVESEILAELIAKGIAVKATTVAGDLRETGAGGTIGREALNYGHTLGHAIERLENYKFRHGAAVSIGMVFAAELGRLAGYLDSELVARHRHVLGLAGLPTGYRSGVWDGLHSRMSLDKKTRGSMLRFVVLRDLAKPVILPNPGDGLLTAAYSEIAQ